MGNQNDKDQSNIRQDDDTIEQAVNDSIDVYGERFATAVNKAVVKQRYFNESDFRRYHEQAQAAAVEKIKSNSATKELDIEKECLAELEEFMSEKIEEIQEGPFPLDRDAPIDFHVRDEVMENIRKARQAQQLYMKDLKPKEKSWCRIL